MKTRRGVKEVLRLGSLSLLCWALLISSAWAGQTFHHFSEDGTPLRAAPSAPKGPAVPQTQLTLPPKLPSPAKVPAVMPDVVTKKSGPQQADGDPDRPMVLGNVYNGKPSGEAAQQGESKLPPVTIMKWGKFNPAPESPGGQGTYHDRGQNMMNGPPLPKGGLGKPVAAPSDLQGKGGTAQPDYARKNMSIVLHDNSDPGAGGETSASKPGGVSEAKVITDRDTGKGGAEKGIIVIDTKPGEAAGVTVPSD